MVVLALVLSAVLSGMGLAQNVASRESPQTEKVYRVVGGGVTPPKLVKHVEPEFSEEAKKDKIEGMVLLSFVVGVDGTPRNIVVKRSLGHGLDEKAVAALRLWTFEPGLKDGHPVPVALMAEVNFHLK